MHSLQDLCTIQRCKAELQPVEAGTNKMRTFMKRRRFLANSGAAHGIPRSEIIGVCGLSTCALQLNTNRPEIKSLADFTARDKIALPGIKTSLAAVVLQMLVAKQFGQANYAKLDPMTVGLPHPDA